MAREHAGSGRKGYGPSLICNTLLIFGFLIGLVHTSSYSLKSSHEGSAPTNEFTLDEAHPDARIIINSSNVVVLININLPESSSEDNPYKVSLELLAMQLCDVNAGDRLKIVYTDPTSIKNEIWKVNVSSSEDGERKEIKDIRANQIVLIPEGRWVLSGADIVATLYQDNADSCKDVFKCSCSSRCISKKVVCNGNPNCGLNCEDDEVDANCPAATATSSRYLPTTNCETSFLPSTTDSSGGTGSSKVIITKAGTLGSLGINMLFMILMSYVIFK